MENEYAVNVIVAAKTWSDCVRAREAQKAEQVAIYAEISGLKDAVRSLGRDLDMDWTDGNGQEIEDEEYGTKEIAYEKKSEQIAEIENKINYLYVSLRENEHKTQVAVGALNIARSVLLDCVAALIKTEAESI